MNQKEQDQLVETIKLLRRVYDEALPKFNWGASALDGNAIALLNQGGMAVTACLKIIAAEEKAR